MEFENLIVQRHACRKFIKKELKREVVLDIVDKARLAPSACNSQPWKVLITTSDEDNSKMIDALTSNGKNAFLVNASAFVAVLDGEAKLRSDVQGSFSNDRFTKYDVGEFVAYLTLYAESIGVSNIIIGWVDNEKLNKHFDTKGLNCTLVVALGFSAEESIQTKNRKSLEEIIL